ncbi:hypothetical protein ACFLZ7_03845 [Nanoarchaeota archaeon]
MVNNYLSDFVKGSGYGLEEGAAVVTLDPQLKPEKPDEIHAPRVFRAGQSVGRVAGGTMAFFFMDLGSLGIIPAHNYFKYREKRKTQQNI